MIDFKKMHGAGNDFILIKKIDGVSDYSKLAKEVCHRNFGIGADGLMVASKSKCADIKMSYYNSDGSVGEMCGNGIRCFSKFVYEENLVDLLDFDVETLAGIKHITLEKSGKEVDSVTVYMGKVVYNPVNISIDTLKQEFIEEIIEINDVKISISTVLMGVPHTIVFVDKQSKDFLKTFGPLIEKHPLFKRGTNVNFVEVVDNNTIIVDTWERGAGNTLACGTGACASAYMAKKLKKLNNQITVHVPGGTLYITLDDKEVYMKGPAVNIATGKYNTMI
ncbi:MAG: diaminopimelate epimerase [Acidaminobacteraceae bacterium]